MIIKVHKYLIFGAREDLDLFYERAQREGFIEFISNRRVPAHLPDSIQIFAQAMKILKTLPVLSQTKKQLSSEEAFALACRTVELKEKIERLYEERRILEVEKARIAPFGDFALEDLQYIAENGHYKIQFFSTKSGKADALLINQDLIRIGTESDLDYFVAINPHVKNYPDLTEMRIEQSLKEIKDQIASVEASTIMMEKEQKELAHYLTAFHEEMIRRLNGYHLNFAKEDAESPLPNTGVFSAEAWIPENKVNRMFSVLSDIAVHCEKIAIEETDRIPTAMENASSGKIGEDLVKFYDIPSITDKDPSRWVFWSFSVFFAIIIADGGYGLLFLLLAAYLKWKWKTFHGATKRLFRLFVTLSIFVVIWGIITSSFFGLDLNANNPLKKISPFTYLVEKKTEYHMQQKDDVYQEYLELTPTVANAKNAVEFLEDSPIARKDFADNILLDLTLVIGICHISFGLLRYARRNWAALGWVCFLIGSYLYFPSGLNATTIVNFMGWISKTSAEALGEKLVCIGFSLAVLLAIIQRRWKGIMEIMNVIQISADVLSYLRLYALALASSIMAATFNDMGEMIGVAGGFLVILAGHLTNISLGTMSGVIHGLRLNFIEWYRYSFEGGGRIFNPLKILRSKED